MVKLGKRLSALYEMVDAGGIAADIGCDHALLCIALMQTHKARHCYACDIAAGPLARAQEAIEQHQLTHDITALQMDGLRDLPEEVDTVIIAGMGYETIRRILLDARAKWPAFHSILLESNTDVEELRRFLSEQHFVIDAERIVKEKHFYQIIKVHYDPDAPLLSEDEMLFGVKTAADPLFPAFWKRQQQRCEAILATMPQTHERRASLEERSARIQKCLDAHRMG